MNAFMDIKKNLRTVARNAAFRVEFLTSGREILLYTNAIYSAMMWGYHVKQGFYTGPVSEQAQPVFGSVQDGKGKDAV